eukprot:COSAG02_NODE_356_length_23978_cov_7.868504_21_plen_93_part_00
MHAHSARLHVRASMCTIHALHVCTVHACTPLCTRDRAAAAHACVPSRYLTTGTGRPTTEGGIRVYMAKVLLASTYRYLRSVEFRYCANRHKA